MQFSNISMSETSARFVQRFLESALKICRVGLVRVFGSCLDVRTSICPKPYELCSMSDLGPERNHSLIRYAKETPTPVTTLLLRSRRFRFLNRTRIHPKIGPSGPEGLIFGWILVRLRGSQSTTPDKDGPRWRFGVSFGALN